MKKFIKTLILFYAALNFSCVLWAQNGTTGNLRWNLSDNGALTVSGSGDIPDYESAGSPWYKHRSKIKTVVIDMGVTRIGNHAFYNASKLASVTIPNSVTSIGKNAFRLCLNLISVTIPNSVTSIEETAFTVCDDMIAIKVDSGNPAYIDEDGILFNIDKTQIILYPEGKRGAYVIPASVTNIGNYAFYFCHDLTSITIPNSVTTITEYAFSSCKNLSEITVSWKNPINIGAKVFSSVPTSATLYVPEGAKSLYREAAGWKQFKIVEGNNAASTKQKPAEVKKHGKRYALVIGNAAYATNPLRNPANDARDIAAKLRKLGFEVKLLTDKDKQDMIEAINNLGTKAKGYEAVMFFYAGHGIQSKHKNYLIPINAKINAESDLEFDGVDVNRVLAKMEDTQCNIKMIVLDACRNNPFERSWRGEGERGLSSMNAPTGTLIAYSTAPNTVALDGPTGRNSPYTGALLSVLEEKLLVEILFKRVAEKVVEKTGGQQAPWIASSLIGDFYFNP